MQDSESFGDGGEANTLITWRVNDTVTFSNISVLSTTLGAAAQLPMEGEGLDGNFGMAKRYVPQLYKPTAVNQSVYSFCAGAPCANYPSFVEAMFEVGVIKSPVLAFYQVRGLSHSHPDPYLMNTTL